MAAGEVVAVTGFTPIPRDKCPECGRIPGDWYDARDRHMVDEYKAGVTVPRLARGYGLADRTVQMKIIERLGMEAMARIQRTHRRNQDEEQ